MGKMVLYLIVAAILILGGLAAYVRLWKTGGSVHSLADCFVTVQNTWELGVLVMPVTVLFLLAFFKYENRSNFLIREKSRSMLWNKQVYKGILFSATMTLYFQSCTFIIGGFASDRMINWNQIGSLYYSNTEGHTNAVSFGMVFLTTTAMVFLKFLNITLMMLLANWVMRRREAYIAVVVLLAGSEYFGRYIPLQIFFERMSVSYTRWLSGKMIWSGLLYGIVLAGILWRVGLEYAKRKDFLNEENGSWQE